MCIGKIVMFLNDLKKHCRYVATVENQFILKIGKEDLALHKGPCGLYY